jgi:hypothetical protein
MRNLTILPKFEFWFKRHYKLHKKSQKKRWFRIGIWLAVLANDPIPFREIRTCLLKSSEIP